MPQEFEEATVSKASPARVRRIADTTQGLHTALDRKRGSQVKIGDRQWMMVLTEEAVERWTDLASKDTTIAVLAYEHTGAVAPFAQRELVLRSRGGALRLDVVDDRGEVLWSGAAEIKERGDLHFDVPITRPGTRRKGRMAGRITGSGQLVLDEARLPRPAKREPTLIEED